MKKQISAVSFCRVYRLTAVLSALLAVMLLCAPAYAHDAGSSIPGEFAPFVKLSEATPYPEAENIFLPADASAEENESPAEENQIQNEDVQTQTDDGTFSINSLDDFRDFVLKCRDQSWSYGRNVSLNCDIDLAGESFDPIPFFDGAFYGNQHTVSNIRISGGYSLAGFFSSLGKDAYVCCLRVTGDICTTGTSIAGGIAGENSGMIQNCIFEGTVTSEYCAGGIAGINFEEAYIADSKTGGVVTATACAAGIAADNKGKLIACENFASVSSGRKGLIAAIDGKSLTGGISATGSGTQENCTDSSETAPLFVINREKAVFFTFVALGVMFLSGAVALIALIGKEK